MHALREFIEAQMNVRGWQQADLVRASGLLKQAVSKMLLDDRPQLTTRIDDVTAAGLAKAFGVAPVVILAKVGEAMGLPVSEPVVIYSAERVSDEALIRALAHRLAKAGEDRGQQPAPIVVEISTVDPREQGTADSPQPESESPPQRQS